MNNLVTAVRRAARAAARLPDFLPWLGGASKGILDQVPQERSRFVQLALVLLTTSGIAMVSMIFAMHDGVRVPLAAAVVTGMIWGFVILNLDRFLVLSMGSTRAGRRLFLMALPRLLLAAVISLVIATPLTLRIFQNDINVQIQKSQAAESKLLKHQITQSGPAQEASQVLGQIQADKKILAGQLPVTVTNPQLQDAQQQISQLQPQVAAAQQKVATTQAAFQCEVDGSGPTCVGASDKSGFGPIAQLKKQEYEDALSAYNGLKGQLASAQRSENSAEQALRKSQQQSLAQAQRTAQQQLPALNARYAALEKQVQTSEGNAQHAVNNDDGILAQLAGLAAAGANDPVLVIAQLTVTALFFLIEILPVSVKILLNMGELTPYEKFVKIENETLLDTKQKSRISARRDAQRALKNHEDVGADMQDRERALAIRANEHVAREMEVILDVALQEWSSQVRATLGTQGAPGSGSPGNGGNSNHNGNGPYLGNGQFNPNVQLSANGPQNVNGLHNGNGQSSPSGQHHGAHGQHTAFGLAEDDDLL